MNNVFENLVTRRCVRSYKSDMIPKETIAKIVEAGTFAACSMGKQASKIVAVTNKEIRDRLSEVNNKIKGGEAGQDPFYGAPVVLIVLADAEGPNRVYDGGCIMQNLMLAAHSFDIGSCWIHRAKETFALPEWKEWLKSIGIEGSYEGIAFCILGYVDGEYPVAADRLPDRVYWVE